MLSASVFVGAEVELGSPVLAGERPNQRKRRRGAGTPSPPGPWMIAVPEVDVARPARCPCCDSVGVAPNGRVVLRGHGIRARQPFGSASPEDCSECIELLQRRYRCRACRSVVVVRPRGLLSRMRYTAAAIALAFSGHFVSVRTERLAHSRQLPTPMLHRFSPVPRASGDGHRRVNERKSAPTTNAPSRTMPSCRHIGAAVAATERSVLRPGRGAP